MNLYKPNEVAQMLRVTPATVRNMIKSGQLPALKLGSGPRPFYRIREADIMHVFKVPMIPREQTKSQPPARDQYLEQCSTRTRNFMEHMQFTWDDLTKYTRKEMFRFRQVGEKTIQELEECLIAQGKWWCLSPEREAKP
jgi:excisionase family DNA binding protein